MSIHAVLFERFKVHPKTTDDKINRFRAGKKIFFVQAKRSIFFAETYTRYVAQVMQQINTAGAEKSPFRMETN
ncbi:MAG: hypothetical protein ABFD50_01555 [Smithella sp.]